MTASGPLLLELEFLRAEQAADPYAFRFVPQEYLLRSAGGGVESSRFPWDDRLLSDLEAIRRPGCDPAIIARLGETLRRFLAPMGWSEQEARLLHAVADRREVLLTVRSAAAELYALPWELLTLKASGQHIAEISGVLLRYEWPETKSIVDEVPRPDGGRILFSWSAAAGEVPAAEQISVLEGACRAGFHPFDARRDILAHTSCGRLSQTLQMASQAGEPFAILHLLCHGGASGTTFGLVFDGEQPSDGPVVVDGGRLRQLLSPYAKTLRLVVLSACDSGNSGELGNQLGSVAQTLHRGGIAAVVASRYPLSVVGSIKLTDVLYHELLGRPASLERALLAARTELAKDATILDWASLQYYARVEDGEDTRPVVFRPYRGLLAFHAEHTRFFFGRDAERATTLEKLNTLRKSRKPRFLIVAGASGTGKSSVVLSGVIPDLLGQDAGSVGAAWEVTVFRPGADPQSALDIALESRSDPTRQLLLVIDQFEEIFTHTTDPAMRREFAARLWALSRQDTSIACILTVRVDYLGHCGELVLDESGLRLDRVAYDEAHRVFVAQLGSAQLLTAIEGPARQVGLELQAGLAARMIDEVEGEPGALPLLSYTLDLLWQKRRGRQLPAQSYGELGGVIGALESKANAVIDGLGPAEQAQARRILVRLVGLGEGATDTRRRIALPTLRALEQARQASFDAVLSAFVDARLLVLSDEQGHVMLEVAHEALIRKWGRLRDWMDQDRDKLVEIHEVERWVTQWRSYGTLLREAQLGYAARVLEKYGEDVSPDGREMITLSQRAEEQLRNRELEQAQRRAEEQTRSARRLRGAAAILVLALVGSIVAGGVARQKSRESKERFLSLLEEQGRQRLLEGDPMRAIVYLAKAYQEGSTGAATRYLLASAASATIDNHLVSLIGHSAPLRAAVFSPDGTVIATASDDQTARLWDARSGLLLRTYAGHSGPVSAVVFSPDGAVIATASEDGTSRLWDAKSGQVLLTLAGHTDKVDSVAFSPDGSRVITAGKDKTARVWDAKSGAMRLLVSDHSEEVTSARFSPDGMRILTASSDKTAKLWDAGNGQPILTLTGHAEPVYSVAFSPDGTRIITASQDRTAKVWDARSGQEIFTLSHQGSVSDAVFSPDGNRALTVSIDLTAKLWDMRSGLALLTLSGHSGWLVAGTFSPDGTRVVTASKDETARVWDLGKSPLLLSHADVVFGARFSPDGRRIVTASADKKAQIWDATNGRLLLTLAGHTDKVYAAAFSPDGRRIVTASGDKTARVWDAENGNTRLTLLGHSDRLREAAFSPDGTRIVTTSRDYTARVWDATSGKLILILAGHSDLVDAGAFSPDGTRILTTSADKTARIWDAGSGQVLLTLTGHVEEISSAAFSPDGRHIITGSHDKTMRLWDATNGRLLRILAGHTDKIFSVAFSPDGARVISASTDMTARLWDWEHGNMILGLVDHSDVLSAAAFSPDGTLVLTASADKTARSRSVFPETRPPEFIARLVRCLIPFRFLNDQVLPAPTEPLACPGTLSH